MSRRIMTKKDVYFEDIFLPIKMLWKGRYELVFGNKSKSLIESLRDDFREVEYTVEVENKKKYNEWHRMMVFVIYQVLSDTGTELLNQGIYTLDMDDIPTERFQKKYLENLQFEGNEKYLANYKGLN